jgi:uncharacterized membrane protein
VRAILSFIFSKLEVFVPAILAVFGSIITLRIKMPEAFERLTGVAVILLAMIWLFVLVGLFASTPIWTGSIIEQAQTAIDAAVEDEKTRLADENPDNDDELNVLTPAMDYGDAQRILSDAQRIQSWNVLIIDLTLVYLVIGLISLITSFVLPLSELKKTAQNSSDSTRESKSSED